MPNSPMGPWMDGCVPDSSRYVPGLRLVQAEAMWSRPAATSVERLHARSLRRRSIRRISGILRRPARSVVVRRGSDSGVVSLRVVAEPPPTWPTITRDVGSVGARPAKRRLLLRLIAEVLSRGDRDHHRRPTGCRMGFSLAQVAVDPSQPRRNCSPTSEPGSVGQVIASRPGSQIDLLLAECRNPLRGGEQLAACAACLQNGFEIG